MPRFSEYFELGLTQHELDFVDVDNEEDTPVYVDPYAIEIRDDNWAAEASEHIRSFFKEVLAAIREGDRARARGLMSHLSEPKETFLGVSVGIPKGRGVGPGQAAQLIAAIANSKAFRSGILEDLSEMALYVEGVDRDKISDLTTNIIRGLLVDYTQEQCDLFGIETLNYNGPSFWDLSRGNWISKRVLLPFIDDQPVLLVPKYIVRRKLSLDSQDFYNKQITDFLIAENLKANSSLVQTIKGRRKVFKGDVRRENPKSKPFISDIVLEHPELLELYKEIAGKQNALMDFGTETPSIHSVCQSLSKSIADLPTGKEHAGDYERLILGALTALFYPGLIQPHREWKINSGRKRIDIVFTNAADKGFFAQRRNDDLTHANVVVVECKNYSSDISNEQLDQLLGRFDRNRGRFGLLVCRSIKNEKVLYGRLLDASSKGDGYVIVLTDDDIQQLLKLRGLLDDRAIERFMHARFRRLLE